MLSVEVRDELAADLAEAERSRVPIAPLTTANPDIDVVDAYEIQLINIRQRRRRGRQGGRPQGGAVVARRCRR